MYHDKIRGIDVELTPTYISNTFEYNGEVYVRLSQTGIDNMKKVLGYVDGDFHYLIVKKD